MGCVESGCVGAFFEPILRVLVLVRRWQREEKLLLLAVLVLFVAAVLVFSVSCVFSRVVLLFVVLAFVLLCMREQILL